MMLQLGLMVLQGTAPRLLPVNTTHITHKKEDNGILMLEMLKILPLWQSCVAYFTSCCEGIFLFIILSIVVEILTWPLVEVTKNSVLYH